MIRRRRQWGVEKHVGSGYVLLWALIAAYGGFAWGSFVCGFAMLVLLWLAVVAWMLELE